MVLEAQQAMMKRYVLSDIGRILCEQLEDYNIIAQKDGGYLILLPEVGTESLAELTEQLRRNIMNRVGADLRIGAASFPEDAVTFEELVSKASKEMKQISLIGRDVIFEHSLELEREKN